MSTKESSTRLAATKAKRANTEQDEANDDLGRDTDSEQHTDSEQAEHQPPPRKRQRATANPTKVVVRKKQVRGKQGRLAGLVNMPIDIFTEITSHLLPGDIINLARSNKFFRNLLMHRSAIHIWHGAMKNVKGLPACPPGMSEPRYLSLLFSKTCSMCGGVARGKMDPRLLVRLCGPCRDSNLVTVERVPLTLMSLIPCSVASVAAVRRRSSGSFVLREELTKVLVEYEENTQPNSKLDAWIKERKEIVAKRREQANVLTEFIFDRELDREKELENAKAVRSSEIKRRLEEMGWSEKEMEFGWRSGNQRAWNDLVLQPKPLTERIWVNIKPKLVSLLQINREECLRAEREARKASRRTCLSELFLGIKLQSSAKLEFKVQRPVHPPLVPKPATTVALQVPFPTLTCTLEWPIIKDLYETDSTTTEMRAKFEERREEIQALVSEWQNMIQSLFVNLVRSGPEVQGDILRPTMIVCDGEFEPFVDMSDDLKLLLRADTLFCRTTPNPSLKLPMEYDTLAHTEGLVGRYDSLQVGLTEPQTAVKLDQIAMYTEAQKVARSLLADMGMPDASYIEMRGIGSDFVCGRCHLTGSMTWPELVDHYVKQNRQFDSIQKRASSSSHSGITYNNVHDPALFTDRPMVEYHSTKVSEETGLSSLQVCQLCEKIAGADKVIASKSKIEKHLRDVHGVAEPKASEHYAPHKVFMSDFLGFDGYDSDDFHYGCGCGGCGDYGRYGSDDEDWW